MPMQVFIIFLLPSALAKPIASLTINAITNKIAPISNMICTAFVIQHTSQKTTNLRLRALFR